MTRGLILDKNADSQDSEIFKKINKHFDEIKSLHYTSENNKISTETVDTIYEIVAETQESDYFSKPYYKVYSIVNCNSNGYTGNHNCCSIQWDILPTHKSKGWSNWK